MFKDDVGHCFYGDTYNVEDTLESAENIADAISSDPSQYEDTISDNSAVEADL